MESLIAPENTWALWSIMVGWVAICLFLDQRFSWAAKVSGPVLILGGAVLLSSTNVIPTASPVYETVWDYVVPVCIPLLLFRADVVTIVKKSGWMFLVFHLAAIGTVVGAFLAALLLAQSGVPELGKLIGIMTGSYTGGGVNFVALTAQFEPAKELSNALLVADNIVMAGLFLICFALTSIPPLRRLFRTPHVDAARQEGQEGTVAISDDGDGDESRTKAAEYWKPKPIGLLDIAIAIAVAVTLAGASHLLADVIRIKYLNQPYLVMTILCVLFASIFRKWTERINGTQELGVYLISLFFFVIGAPADVVMIVREVPVLFVLCGIMAFTNLVVTLGLTWLFRRNLEEAALAVNASLGGAPSAAAMAIAKGWTPLVLPSILVGVWGYVAGTWIGLLVGETLIAWLTAG